VVAFIPVILLCVMLSMQLDAKFSTHSVNGNKSFLVFCYMSLVPFNLT